MFVDSHCHLNFPELMSQITAVREAMAREQVTHALCIGVNMAEFPGVLSLAETYANIYATVGVHPDYGDADEPSTEQLVALAQHDRVVAIGETGLDYYRLQGDLQWQRQRFRVHIQAAKQCGKPLVVHTRSAGADTLRIMEEEDAASVGGVMHCFTETQAFARRAIELNFHISFSGIVTFKNASELREVAKHIPLERLLIETDSPYLAPVPFRGKLNQPAYVRYVAQEIARIRGLTIEEVGRVTTQNFFRLFNITDP